MTEKTFDPKQAIAELTKSVHGDLDAYMPVGFKATLADPDFFAHLVAWNHLHGKVRDAKIALPVIALSSFHSRVQPGIDFDPYIENALAHLADLRPRELARVLLITSRSQKMDVTTQTDKKKRATTFSVPVPPFAKTAGAPTRILRRLLTRYLRDLESDRRSFEYVAVQHRHVLHNLYARHHIARPGWVGEILFHGEKGMPTLPPGIFSIIRRLSTMPVTEAAGMIVKYKIPFLIARGALGKKASDSDTVLALIKAMSPTELTTNMGWLEKLGVKTNPALRAALEEALGKAATSTKATLKTSRAAEALADDEQLSSKLKAVQEKQLKVLGGIDGDWLVFADKSGSMERSIDVGRQVTAILARMVKGSVHLVFFDTMPRYFNATGKSYDEIQALTRSIAATGGTRMACGVDYATANGLHADGMVFIGDGANNYGMPPVLTAYRNYVKKLGVEPTLYFYELDGEADNFTHEFEGQPEELTTFELRGKKIDYNSLPNLVATMRVNRYALLDEIMATPLQTVDAVLDKTIGMQILAAKEKVTA